MAGAVDHREAIDAGPMGLLRRLVRPGIIDNEFESIIALGIRLYIAQIFYRSGILRVNSWDSQEFMFTDIHPVPFLPPTIAAPVTTLAELCLAMAFAFGLLGRISGMGLLIMTLVIQLIVAQTPQGVENHIGNSVHYFWMLLCLMVAINGPGRMSIDRMIWERIR